MPDARPLIAALLALSACGPYRHDEPQFRREELTALCIRQGSNPVECAAAAEQSIPRRDEELRACLGRGGAPAHVAECWSAR